MKSSLVVIFMGCVFSFFTMAANILDSNKELYEKANNGDVESMKILSHYYINQYSRRWNPERSRYWECRIHELKNTISTELNCQGLLTIGEEKDYKTFIESGQITREIKVSSNAEDNFDLKVPAEREWHIQWNYSECERICSYEIAIDGYYYIGANKNYLIGRKSSISLNGTNGEIWVSTGSIVTLQLDSKLVKITEYAM